MEKGPSSFKDWPVVEKVNEVLFLESDRIDWFTLLDDHGTEITEGITSELEFNFETLDVNGRNALHTAVIKNDPDLIKVRTPRTFIFVQFTYYILN